MTHILVVDNLPAQVILNKALTKLGGYTVTATDDVWTALALAHSGKVALAVVNLALDLSRSNWILDNALELIRKLKGDPGSHTVLVLMITSDKAPHEAERLCHACGADDYLAGPFVEPQKLVDKVRAMLAA